MPAVGQDLGGDGRAVLTVTNWSAPSPLLSSRVPVASMPSMSISTSWVYGLLRSTVNGTPASANAVSVARWSAATDAGVHDRRRERSTVQARGSPGPRRRAHRVVVLADPPVGRAQHSAC